MDEPDTIDVLIDGILAIRRAATRRYLKRKAAREARTASLNNSLAPGARQDIERNEDSPITPYNAGPVTRSRSLPARLGRR